VERFRLDCVGATGDVCVDADSSCGRRTPAVLLHVATGVTSGRAPITSFMAYRRKITHFLIFPVK